MALFHEPISEKNGGHYHQMNHFPKVSVIVPVYNLEKYISRCLDSILEQSFSDLECICVNDGSTDSSALILDGYLKKDFRIKVIHKENGGLPSARKAGIEQARGEFIIHVDGDDFLEPDALQELLDEQSLHDADLVFSDYYIDDEDLHTCARNSDYSFRNAQTVTVLTTLLEKECFFIWGKLIRRALYKDVILPPEIKYTEDMVHLIQIASNCHRASCVNKLLYHYVKRTGSMTHALGKDALRQWYAASQFCVNHCRILPFANNLTKHLLKLQANQADIYLSFISATGYYRKDLRTIVANILLNWSQGGKYAITQLPGSSKLRLFLCLFSTHFAVAFGKTYNKLVHHV